MVAEEILYYSLFVLPSYQWCLVQYVNEYVILSEKAGSGLGDNRPIKANLCNSVLYCSVVSAPPFSTSAPVKEDGGS